MWSLARGIAQYSLKNSRNIQKPRGQSLVGFAHSGLPPRFLDILSRLFMNILQSTLANLHILLQYEDLSSSDISPSVLLKLNRNFWIHSLSVLQQKGSSRKLSIDLCRAEKRSLSAEFGGICPCCSLALRGSCSTSYAHPFPVCSGASRHRDVEARLSHRHRRQHHRAQGPPHFPRQRNLPLRSVPDHLIIRITSCLHYSFF